MYAPSAEGGGFAWEGGAAGAVVKRPIVGKIGDMGMEDEVREEGGGGCAAQGVGSCVRC